MATTLPRVTTREKVETKVVTGPAAAAFMSAGIGCFVLGLMVTGAEYFPALKTALTWNTGVGPLSGKTLVAVIAYFVAWGVTQYLWKDKDVDLKKYFTWSMGLLALGFLLTFPIFFEMFTRS